MSPLASAVEAVRDGARASGRGGVGHGAGDGVEAGAV